MRIIGDVKGRAAVIVDDIIDTAGTMCKAAEAVMAAGAERVLACAAHGVLSGAAVERISKSVMDKVVITDTISPRPDVLAEKRIKVVSVAELIAASDSPYPSAKSRSVLCSSERKFRSSGSDGENRDSGQQTGFQRATRRDCVRAGQLPGIVYGAGGGDVAVAVELRQFERSGSGAVGLAHRAIRVRRREPQRRHGDHSRSAGESAERPRDSRRLSCAST